jgi:hypothetical protein
MAKKPVKKNTAKGRHKRLTKSKVVKRDPGVLEYGGYKLGQEVWVRLELFGGKEDWGFGTIYSFHPTDSVEPSFTFFDKLKKKWGCAAVSGITESPPKKWMRKI